MYKSHVGMKINICRFWWWHLRERPLGKLK